MTEYIERKKAVEWFMAFVHMGDDSIPTETVISDLNHAIPSADVAPVRHGRWICADNAKCKCSECDTVAFIALYPPFADKNYCPNCGAKMNGGTENA